jgi:hypothetical protein
MECINSQLTLSNSVQFKTLKKNKKEKKKDKKLDGEEK